MLKLSLLAMALLPNLVYAWGDLGHQAVGEIAERNLSAKGKALVFHILGAEPLAFSATYPDDVRFDSRFKELDAYHFCEIPEGVKGYEHKDPSQVIKGDANAFISKVPALLTDGTVSQKRKVILLRYLAHTVGDVHNPLHVGNGLDQGGNLCLVNWVVPGTGALEKTNLHTVWDERILDVLKEKARVENEKKPIPSKRYFNYPELVGIIDRDVLLSEAEKEEIVKTPIPHWYDESRALHPLAYDDKIVQMNPKERAFCQIPTGNFNPSSVPTLGEGYAKKVLPILEKQLLIGGLRLAHLINEAAKNFEVVSKPEEEHKDLIKSLLLENE